MKSLVTILSLLAISLTVQAGTIIENAKQLADQRVESFKYNSADQVNSKGNAKDYYQSKLSLCLMEQDFKNETSDKQKSIDLNACSGVINQALRRGDLNENGVREVIDSVAQSRRDASAEKAKQMERQKQILQQTKELVDYGNQRLN